MAVCLEGAGSQLQPPKRDGNERLNVIRSHDCVVGVNVAPISAPMPFPSPLPLKMGETWRSPQLCVVSLTQLCPAEDIGEELPEWFVPALCLL